MFFSTLSATCFFLGIIFSLFPYDYPLLWSGEPTPPSHYDYLEAHLRFLHASPPLIPRILHIVIFLGFAGLFAKLYKPSESNMLFDGASLVLYVCGVTVYIANIVKGLRLVTGGKYGADLADPDSDDDPSQILGREDSLKVLAASNTILALVLVGVLVLQAGQWYAEKKDEQEYEKLAAGERSASSSGETREQPAETDDITAATASGSAIAEKAGKERGESPAATRSSSSRQTASKKKQ